MRSLTAEKQDERALQDLGLASVQVVHDLKNQLNALKLYATFLRRRIETSERPADELEVIDKLMAGIERTTGELTILARYGRPIELRTRPGVALDRILHSLKERSANGDEVHLEIEDVSITGEFDVVALAEAFRSITDGAVRMRRNGDQLLIHQSRDEESAVPHVLIEWRNIDTSEKDVFRSFAGADALRMALAAKVIEAHHGKAEQQAGKFRVSLPIQVSDRDCS